MKFETIETNTETRPKEGRELVSGGGSNLIGTSSFKVERERRKRGLD